MLQRAITGFFFLIVLIGCILWNKYSLITLFSLAGGIGVFEFMKLKQIESKEATVFGIIGSLLTVSILLNKGVLLPFVIPVVFLVFCFKHKTLKPETLAWFCMGLVYSVGGFTMISNIALNTANYTEGSFLLLLVFIAVWTNDTGAYLSGKFLGKNKMAPEISPNKTWEGTIGGLLLAGVLAGVFNYYNTILPQTTAILIGLLAGLCSTLGDLFESYLKRHFNIKDSGKILPGHGGVLDRFDGALFAAPVVWFCLSVLPIFN